MAVYTKVSFDQIAHFLSSYSVGSLISAEGICQGIDNSNYRIETDHGLFILTIFENRVDPLDLPFFMGFIDHLSKRGIICPSPIRTQDNHAVLSLSNKPAALFPFLEGCGVIPAEITPHLCYDLGVLLGKMHLAGQSFEPTRNNSMNIDAWDSRLKKTQENGIPFLNEISYLKENWPDALPIGAIHADLFPDNVFVLDHHIHGVIDFYFSATDFLAYDLAIVTNAWCFDDNHVFQTDRWFHLLKGYSSLRQLEDHEKEQFQILARGASMRFLSSRLHDLVFHDEKALVVPKDPKEYIKKLEFHRETNLFQ